jgi:hypothetical protein
MILEYLGQCAFDKAWRIFQKQTEGKASMKEAFDTAGPLTCGLTLRQAIEYVEKHLTFVDGFHELLAYLRGIGAPLVINSTGYTVTLYAIREMLEAGDVLHGFIGNELHFSWHGSLDFPTLPSRQGCCVTNSQLTYLPHPSITVSRGVPPRARHATGSSVGSAGQTGVVGRPTGTHSAAGTAQPRPSRMNGRNSFIGSRHGAG